MWLTVFTVTFDSFNASLIKVLQILVIPNIWMVLQRFEIDQYYISSDKE